MWQTPQREGFVELEQNFARLLRNKGGTTWVSKIVNPNESGLLQAVAKELPEFFEKGTLINFICTESGGFQLVDFPKDLKKTDIINNLKLNKKELFNTKTDLTFNVYDHSFEADTKKVAVSFLPTSVIEDITQAIAGTDFKLGKITTGPDTLMGAFARIYTQQPGVTDLIIQVGYSRVHLIAIQNNKIIQQRSLLTGSLKELESVLFSAYSVVREDAWLMLSKNHQHPVQVIEDTINNNRFDLLTRIGGFVAELRAQKLLSEGSKIYVHSALVDEPDLASIIYERFGLETIKFNGMANDEKGLSFEDFTACWLSGAHSPIARNITQEKSVASYQLAVTPKFALICAIIFTLAPFAMLNLADSKLNNLLLKVKSEYANVETMRQDIKNAAEEQAKLLAVSKEIAEDLANRGIATKITRVVTENLPESCRLQSIDLNLKDGKTFITGFAVDTETALKYYDIINKCLLLSKPKLTIDTTDPIKVYFTITAYVGEPKTRSKKGK